MLMPSIFGENLLDDFFGEPFGGYDYSESGLMTTDVKDTDKGYEVTMNMPGVKKEDVKAELKDGYLTVSAAKGLDQDEQEKETGRYIRRERYSGSCSRSFYVGDGVKQEDIKAKFEDGTLKLFVPKEAAKPAVEQKKYISIEG